jgi:hypothetical protein
MMWLRIFFIYNCLFVISGRTELFLEECVMRIKCRFAQIPDDWSPGRLVAQAIKYCTVAPYIFCTITVVRFPLLTKLYITVCYKATAPDDSEYGMSLQNCESSVWCLYHFSVLAPRIWRWRLDF